MESVDTPELAIAMTLNNWGTTKAALGQHENAIELHRRSLAIREKEAGPESAEVPILIDTHS